MSNTDRRPIAVHVVMSDGTMDAISFEPAEPEWVQIVWRDTLRGAKHIYDTSDPECRPNRTVPSAYFDRITKGDLDVIHGMLERLEKGTAELERIKKKYGI